MNDSMADPAGPEPGEEPGQQPGAAGLPPYEPSAPHPLGVERLPTGDPAADELLARLGDADHLPAEGHLEVYEDVHRGLRDALTGLDARPVPQGPPPPAAPSPAYDHRS